MTTYTCHTCRIEFTAGRRRPGEAVCCPKCGGVIYRAQRLKRPPETPPVQQVDVFGLPVLIEAPRRRPD